MANLTELLAKVAGLLPEDSGEAKALIAEAKREATNLYDDLKSANAESKSRKEQIRELKSELEGKADFTETEKTLKAEIARLKSVEAEHQTYLKAQDEKVLNQWSEKAKAFEIPKEDKRFEKIEAIKSKFTFPAEGETLTIEQAKANLDKFGILEDTGIFTIPDEHTPNPHPPTPGSPGKPQYATSGEALWAQTQKNNK